MTAMRIWNKRHMKASKSTWHLFNLLRNHYLGFLCEETTMETLHKIPDIRFYWTLTTA